MSKENSCLDYILSESGARIIQMQRRYNIISTRLVMQQSMCFAVAEEINYIYPILHVIDTSTYNNEQQNLYYKISFTTHTDENAQKQLSLIKSVLQARNYINSTSDKSSNISFKIQDYNGKLYEVYITAKSPNGGTVWEISIR